MTIPMTHTQPSTIHKAIFCGAYIYDIGFTCTIYSSFEKEFLPLLVEVGLQPHGISPIFEKM